MLSHTDSSEPITKIRNTGINISGHRKPTSRNDQNTVQARKNKHQEGVINTACQSITQHFVFICNKNSIVRATCFDLYKVIFRPSGKTDPRATYISMPFGIVYCQGDMFRPLLGHRQAVWENRSKRYLYFNAIWHSILSGRHVSTFIRSSSGRLGEQIQELSIFQCHLA